MIERIKRFLHKPAPVEAGVSHEEYLVHTRALYIQKGLELDEDPYREKTRRRVYQ